MDKKDNSIHKVKTVGILGATGIIGELLTELLRQRNFSVLRGSRSLKNGYGTQSVNIDDAVSVKKFVDQCNIVINCTGPSLLTSKKILPVIIEAEKDYIDAFGWTRDAKYLNQRKSRIILNSGSVPGILGVLIKNMWNEKSQKVKVWSGGREMGSIGSIGDIILSSVNGYGKSNYYMEQAKVVKSIKPSIELFDNADIFPDDISTQLVLTDEMEAVSQYLGIRDLWNYTIWADKHMKQIMMTGCMEAVKLKKEEELKELFATMLEKMRKLNGTKQTWFTIVIEVVGGNGKNILRLDTDNSFKLTASMIAHMVDILLYQKIPRRTYWPFELADPNEVLKFIQKIGTSIDIYGEL